MFSKRYRKLLIKKKPNYPDWTLLAYVLYVFRNYSKSLPAIEFGDIQNKFLGD